MSVTGWVWVWWLCWFSTVCVNINIDIRLEDEHRSNVGTSNPRGSNVGGPHEAKMSVERRRCSMHRTTTRQ